MDDDTVELNHRPIKSPQRNSEMTFPLGLFMNPKHSTDRMPAIIPMMEIRPEEAMNLTATKQT
jgi:hypothetical protein